MASLDDAVHPFGLTLGSTVVWLVQLVLDAVLVADAAEDVGAEIEPARPVAVLRHFGESHGVIL